jgi:hypothetical protein
MRIFKRLNHKFHQNQDYTLIFVDGTVSEAAIGG